MEMIHGWWNSPDSFSTFSESLQSAFTSMFCCGANSRAHFYTISMIFSVPVSGNMQVLCYAHLKTQRCNSLTTGIFKKLCVRMCFLARLHSFNRACFTAEADGGAAFVLTSRRRSLRVFWSFSPHPCPSSVPCCSWSVGILRKLNSTPQRGNICWRPGRGKAGVDKEAFGLEYFFFLFLLLEYLSQVRVFMCFNL